MLLRQYTAFLTIGKANEQFYRANGVSQRRFFPGLYCVDNERFAAQAAELRPRRSQLRSEWGVPLDAFTFLFAGKLVEKKRPLDLVEACSRLHEIVRPRAIHLLVAGDGPLQLEVKERARRRGLPVSFAGFLNQSEIAKAYVAADALALPSDAGETWGLVVNEAMACGLPVVVSNQVGCHQDLVMSGQTGFVFPCGDAGAMTDALRLLADDPVMARNLGENASRHVATYSVAALVEGSLASLRAVTRGAVLPLSTPRPVGSC
jgi:glycosyltransferase involved in cell wall biosynthesis